MFKFVLTGVRKFALSGRWSWSANLGGTQEAISSFLRKKLTFTSRDRGTEVATGPGLFVRLEGRLLPETNIYVPNLMRK
jgi:hypothetical protein